MEDIKQNLLDTKHNIEMSLEKSRYGQSVELIAVSKTKPVEYLKEAYNQGIRLFGENKVQEMVDKYEVLPKDIQWHMIGHLQRNKVKYIAPFVSLIHSVDSIRLADEIEKQAQKISRELPILIEVNMGREESKFGFMEEEVIPFLRRVPSYQFVKVVGLMTSAQYVEDSEENREIFHKMKQLSVDIEAENIDNVNMKWLSMGMSNDYQIAIEEGSNMVRIGTGIFGKRNYLI